MLPLAHNSPLAARVAADVVPTPFHVIFHAENRDRLALEQKLSALGYASDDIGVSIQASH
jgi:hypothetical protein